MATLAEYDAAIASLERSRRLLEHAAASASDIGSHSAGVATRIPQVLGGSAHGVDLAMVTSMVALRQRMVAVRADVDAAGALASHEIRRLEDARAEEQRRLDALARRRS